MAANALRILGLCLTAALICASLRSAHPQIASAVALAAGVAALMLSAPDIRSFSDVLDQLDQYVRKGGAESMYLLKICALAMVAEFASDICRDAGEAALARRIDTGVKLGIAATSVPVAAEIMAGIAGLLE